MEGWGSSYLQGLEWCLERIDCAEPERVARVLAATSLAATNQHQHWLSNWEYGFTTQDYSSILEDTTGCFLQPMSQLLRHQGQQVMHERLPEGRVDYPFDPHELTYYPDHDAPDGDLRRRNSNFLRSSTSNNPSKYCHKIHGVAATWECEGFRYVWPIHFSLPSKLEQGGGNYFVRNVGAVDAFRLGAPHHEMGSHLGDRQFGVTTYIRRCLEEGTDAMARLREDEAANLRLFQPNGIGASVNRLLKDMVRTQRGIWTTRVVHDGKGQSGTRLVAALNRTQVVSLEPGGPRFRIHLSAAVRRGASGGLELCPGDSIAAFSTAPLAWHEAFAILVHRWSIEVLYGFFGVGAPDNRPHNLQRLKIEWGAFVLRLLYGYLACIRASTQTYDDPRQARRARRLSKQFVSAHLFEDTTVARSILNLIDPFRVGAFESPFPGA